MAHRAASPTEGAGGEPAPFGADRDDHEPAHSSTSPVDPSPGPQPSVPAAPDHQLPGGPRPGPDATSAAARPSRHPGRGPAHHLAPVGARTGLPGFAPVSSPSSTTSSPFTIT